VTTGTIVAMNTDDTYATGKTFAELGVDPDLVVSLATHESPRLSHSGHDNCQRLAGHDVSGKAKTGSGKALGFGLPMLQRVAALEPLEPGTPRPRGLVVSRRSWPCRSSTFWRRWAAHST
jgi:superfamily II DNA/RNA helicase